MFYVNEGVPAGTIVAVIFDELLSGVLAEVRSTTTVISFPFESFTDTVAEPELLDTAAKSPFDISDLYTLA